MTRPASGRTRPAEAVSAPVLFKTTALASAEVCPKSAPARGAGAGRHVPPRSPSPSFPPADPLSRTRHLLASEIRDISGMFPGHVRHPPHPLKNNSLSFKTVVLLQRYKRNFQRWKYPWNPPADVAIMMNTSTTQPDFRGVVAAPAARAQVADAPDAAREPQRTTRRSQS